MADCHQRLDPGRHPDGFVPSHEVVRVHDLLGECIRALGHASILDHPQQQPVYNPGHIRRRADTRRDAPHVGVRRGGRGQRRLQVEEEEVHTPVESHRMSQDEDATDDDYVESDTHTPAFTFEPSTSYTPRFEVRNVKYRVSSPSLIWPLHPGLEWTLYFSLAPLMHLSRKSHTAEYVTTSEVELIISSGVRTELEKVTESELKVMTESKFAG
ncbi:hypothetical protein DM860_009682 [Cuscuta australis]|uniref:Uncharacterized protein n=1 Tax=Cuscuta australis TaxID=267555 RepID=A0A328DMF2_9ASTE|nr:hypothetical protein DM860_009682 [Cuscuta australis]